MIDTIGQVLVVVGMVALYLAGLFPDWTFDHLPGPVRNELSLLGGMMYLPGDDPLIWLVPPRR